MINLIIPNPRHALHVSAKGRRWCTQWWEIPDRTGFLNPDRFFKPRPVFRKGLDRTGPVFWKPIVFFRSDQTRPVFWKGEGPWRGTCGKWPDNDWKMTWKWPDNERNITGKLLENEWKMTGKLVENDWKMIEKWTDNDWKITGKWPGNDQKMTGK